MDELYHFPSMFFALLIGLVPLGVGLLILRSLHWNGGRSVLHFAWWSCLSFWVSTAVVSAVFGMNDQMFRPSVGIAVYLTWLFLANTLSIGLVLKWLSKDAEQSGELLNGHETEKKSRHWAAAALIAVLSIVSIAGLGSAVFDLRKKLIPEEKLEFAPYDI